MDNVNEYAVFVAVSEQQGFSAAARELGMTTAGVSKSVSRLEARLQVRLFTRTTRRVALTDEGATFYREAKRILDDVEAAEAELADRSDALAGRLRIELPVLFGQRFVLPLLSEFLKDHPGILLDVRLSDRSIDLLAEGTDVAVRMGSLSDSTLRSRKIGSTRSIVCASPRYFAQHGEPITLNHLHEHRCVAYVLRNTGRPYPWRFKLKRGFRTFEPPLDLTVDDGIANKMLGVLGNGLIYDFSFHFDEELADGTLVEVLSAFSAPGPPISLVYPAGKYLPKRTRALLDFIVDRLDGFSPD